jgi:hypothetical protein
MSLTLRTVNADGSYTKNDTLTFTELDNNFVYLSQSFADNYTNLSQSIAQGGVGNLQESLTSTVSIGSVVANQTIFAVGTSLEYIIRQMLTSTSAASISNFSIKNGSTSITIDTTKEVGTSYSTFNTVYFEATAATPSAKFPISASFTASVPGNAVLKTYLSNTTTATNTFSLPDSYDFQIYSAGSATFTINTKEPNTRASLALTKTTTCIYPILYGMSAVDYSSTGNLSDLTKLLETCTVKKELVISGASKYIYFAYPALGPTGASNSDLSSILDGGDRENLDNFKKITRTISSPTSLWSNVIYKIYMARWDGSQFWPTDVPASPVQTWKFIF